MSDLLINPLIKMIQDEFELRPPILIDIDELTEDDKSFIEKECLHSPSQFDQLNLRKLMYTKFLKGDAVMCVKESIYGKIIAIVDNAEELHNIPWKLWARIFRIFSESKKTISNNNSFRVLLLGNNIPRIFPKKGEKIEPMHINGGYTYSCNKKSIVIYRSEDATRVLIHELMHGCCLDDKNSDINSIESETEAWAEVIYFALISQGKKFIFNALMHRQSEYMRKQNEILRKHYKVNENNKTFPWRYTLGKQDVWQRWNILKERDAPPKINIHDSLRLTFPPNNMLKERFNVSYDSNML